MHNSGLVYSGLESSCRWRFDALDDHGCILLAQVYGWFTEGFDTLDLKEARRCLTRWRGKGHSRLMGLDELGTVRALREHRAVSDALVAKHEIAQRAITR